MAHTGAVKSHARVLVIEDDADSRALFAEILAESGIEAVPVDHDALPEPDGFTVVISDLPCSRTRYSTEWATNWVELLTRRYLAPVIVLTGHTEAMRDARLRRAASYIIAKPIDVSAFVEVVRKADGAMRPRAGDGARDP